MGLKKILSIYLIIFAVLNGSPIPYALAETSSKSAEVSSTPPPTAVPASPINSAVPSPASSPSPKNTPAATASNTPLPTPSQPPSSTPPPTTTPTPTPTLIPPSPSAEKPSTFSATLEPSFTGFTGISGPSARIRRPIIVHPLFKKDLKASDKITFNVDNADGNEVLVNLYNNQKEKVSVNLEKDVSENGMLVKILPLRTLIPGKYTIKISDQTGKTDEEVVNWGNLAINSNKSVYQKNDKVNLAIALIGLDGKTICDGNLTLKVQSEKANIDQELSTENGKITRSTDCNNPQKKDKPDYEASFSTKDPGTYILSLKAEKNNETFEISDYIEVKENEPLIIERSAPTRVSSQKDYPVTLDITSNNDFKGKIVETVPDSLELRPPEKAVNFTSQEEVSENQNDNVLGAETSAIRLPFDGSFIKTLGFGELSDNPKVEEEYKKLGLIGHDGIDFDMPIGTEIKAVSDGKVELARDADYGETVVINHSWGKSFYGHLSKIYVKEGQNISKSDVLGLSGESGFTTGPHLHFAIKPNSADLTNGFYGKIDPAPFLDQKIAANLKVKRLTWDVNLKKGEKITLGYNFSSPDITNSQIYQSGPLTAINSGGTTVYQESLMWQTISFAEEKTAFKPIPTLLFKPNQKTRKTQIVEGINNMISIKSEENPEFEFDMKDAKFDNLWKEKADKRKTLITARVQHTKIEKDNLPVDISFDDQNHKLIISPQNVNQFQAGLYHITATIPTANGNITIDQDFSWGVLAVNMNKSMYTKGETVNLGMAVLNDTGKTLCITASDETRTAKVWLTITSPTGATKNFSTEDGTIIGNPDCFDHSVTNIADYLANYNDTTEVGNYKIHLTAQNVNGTRELDDSFDVKDTLPFDVERTSFPTRIFPPADYPNKFTIKANQDFSGAIQEAVPDSFEIKDTSPNAEVISQNNEKTIVWNLDLKKGDQIKLSYTFLAPNVSPEFYLLGPLKFIDSSQTEVFVEARQWQIAADTTITSAATGLWGTGATWTGNVAPGTGDVAQIRNTHVVTLNASPTIQAIIIDSGGTLTNNGSTFTLTLTNTSGTLFTFTSGGTFTPGTFITVTMNPVAAITCFGGTGSLTGTNSLYILNLTPALGALSRIYTLGTVALKTTSDFNINPSRSTASTVYSLTVNMGNTVTVGGTLNITKTGSYAASVLSTNTTNAITAGKINIATGGTFQAWSAIITLNGTTSTLFTRSTTSPAGIFSSSGSTVIFQPGASVTLTSGTFQTTNAFNNLTFDASGYTGTLGSSITINSTFAINNGTLADGGNQIIGTAAKSMTMAAGTQLTLGASTTATAFPTNYANATIALNVTSTVLYNTTTTAQTISGVPTYGNLSTAATGASTKTAGAAVVVKGDFTNGTNVTYNTSAVSNYALTVSGNYTNSGTFTPNTARVTFDSGATGKTISGTLNGTSSFYKVTFNNASGGWTIQDPMIVDSLATNATDTFVITAGTVTLGNGTGDNLEVDGGKFSIASGATFQTMHPLAQGSTVTININHPALTHTCTNCIIDVSGTMTVNENATLMFNSFASVESGAEVSSTGILNIQGSLDYSDTTVASTTPDTKVCATADITADQTNKTILMTGGLAKSRIYTIQSTVFDGSDSTVCVTGSHDSNTITDAYTLKTDASATFTPNATAANTKICSSIDTLITADNTGVGDFIHDTTDDKYFRIVDSTNNDSGCSNKDSFIVIADPDALTYLTAGDAIKMSQGIKAADTYEILDYATVTGNNATHRGYIYSQAHSETNIQYAELSQLGDSAAGNCTLPTNNKCGLVALTITGTTAGESFSIKHSYLHDMVRYLDSSALIAATIDGNNITNTNNVAMSRPIHLGAGSNGTIFSNNRIDLSNGGTAPDVGISTQGAASYNVVMANNIVSNISARTLEYTDGSTNGIIYGNMLFIGSTAVYVDLTSKVTVVNNTIFHHSGDALHMYGSNTNRYAGNKIFNCAVAVYPYSTSTNISYSIDNTYGVEQVNSSYDVNFSDAAASVLAFNDKYGSATPVNAITASPGYLASFKHNQTAGSANIWGEYSIPTAPTETTPQVEEDQKFNYADNLYEDSVTTHLYYGSGSEDTNLDFAFSGAVGGSNSHYFYRVTYNGTNWDVYRDETSVGTVNTASTFSGDSTTHIQFNIATASYAKGDTYTFIVFKKSSDTTTQKTVTMMQDGDILTVPANTTLELKGQNATTNPSIITRGATGGYHIDVNATIDAQYYQMNYLGGTLGGNGLYLKTNTIVTNLANGTFNNFQNVGATDAFITIDGGVIGTGTPSKTWATMSFTGSGGPPSTAPEFTFRMASTGGANYWNIQNATCTDWTACNGSESESGADNIRWTTVSTGPTSDQQMRHGDWFNSSGARQFYTF